MVVTWGEVRLDITMCSAILMRIWLIGSMRVLAGPAGGIGAPGPGAAAGVGAAGAGGAGGGAEGRGGGRLLGRCRRWRGLSGWRGRSLLRRGRSRRGLRRCRSAGLVDSCHDGIDPDGLSFLHQDLAERSGGGRRDFGIYLIGRDFKQRLVALTTFAGTPEPFRQVSFYNPLRHLG